LNFSVLSNLGRFFHEFLVKDPVIEGLSFLVVWFQIHNFLEMGAT